MPFLLGNQIAELADMLTKRFKKQVRIEKILDAKDIAYDVIEQQDTKLWLTEIITRLNNSQSQIVRVLNAFAEECEEDSVDVLDILAEYLRQVEQSLSNNVSPRPAAGWPTHIVLLSWVYNGANKSQDVVYRATEALEKILIAGSNGAYEVVLCSDWQNDIPVFGERDRPLFIFVAYDKKIRGAQDEFKDTLEDKGMGQRDFGKSIVVWSVTERDAPYRKGIANGIPPVSVETSTEGPYQPLIWFGTAEAVAYKARTKFLAAGHAPAIGMEIGEYPEDIKNFVKAIISQATDRLFVYGPPSVEPEVVDFDMNQNPTNNSKYLGYLLSQNQTNGFVVIVHDFSIPIEFDPIAMTEAGQSAEDALKNQQIPRLIQTVKARNKDIDSIAIGDGSPKTPIVKVILVGKTPIEGKERSISEKCPNWILVTHKRSTNVSPESIRGSYEEVIEAIRQRVISERGLL